MGNGAYPKTDLILGQELKNKIQFFFNFTFYFSVLGSNLFQVAPFLTTAGHEARGTRKNEGCEECRAHNLAQSIK